MVINTPNGFTKYGMLGNACVTPLGNWEDGSFTDINQVADHLDSVKNLLEDAMTTQGIDLSVHNCVVSVQTHVFWVFFSMSFVQRINNAGPKTESWGTTAVTLPQVECDALSETDWTTLNRIPITHIRFDPLMPY